MYGKNATFFRGQIFGLTCSRVYKQYDYNLYGSGKPFKIMNNSILMDYLKILTKHQQNWFQSIKASWNGIIEPPFADILTMSIYGKTFNIVEMSDLFYENRFVKFEGF